MAYEKRDLTGTLFKNDKMMNDKSPQYTGSVTIDGVDYWQSAWVKEGKSGKFMGLALSPKEPMARPSERSKVTKFDDGDMPF